MGFSIKLFFAMADSNHLILSVILCMYEDDIEKVEGPLTKECITQIVSFPVHHFAGEADDWIQSVL